MRLNLILDLLSMIIEIFFIKPAHVLIVIKLSQRNSLSCTSYRYSYFLQKASFNRLTTTFKIVKESPDLYITPVSWSDIPDFIWFTFTLWMSILYGLTITVLPSLILQPPFPLLLRVHMCLLFSQRTVISFGNILNYEGFSPRILTFTFPYFSISSCKQWVKF